MKISIGIAAGVEKTECEDTAFCNDLTAVTGIHEYEIDALRCLGAADGVGGNAGGSLASRFVATKFTETDFSEMTEPRLGQFVDALNAELIRHAAEFPDKSAMATTVSAIVSATDGIYLLHGGNTRLYVMQGDYLKQVTTDHTTYQRLRELGQFEAAESCGRSEIYCCLGGGAPRYATGFVIRKLFDTELPHRLVLTSDGIHEYVDIDTMETLLTSGEADEVVISRLMKTAIANGSRDDMTVIIASNK